MQSKASQSQCNVKEPDLYTLWHSFRGFLIKKYSREFPGFPGTPLKIPVSRELENGREIGNTRGMAASCGKRHVLHSLQLLPQVPFFNDDDADMRMLQAGKNISDQNFLRGIMMIYLGP